MLVWGLGRCGCGECVYVHLVQVFCLVLDMSVVRGVGGVCDICMCLARGGVGGVVGVCVTELGLGFTNSGGTWGKWDMCLCFGCGSVGGVGGECVGGLVQGLGGWGDVMYVRVVSLNYLC